eukprot:3519221-Amphidinium_carterae.1
MTTTRTNCNQRLAVCRSASPDALCLCCAFVSLHCLVNGSAHIHLGDGHVRAAPQSDFTSAS